MSTIPLIKKFMTLSEYRKPMMRDDEIALQPNECFGYSKRIQVEHTFIFNITTLLDRQTIGEIALRIGDSPEQFYLGHIGYHVDPPYRGHAYAAKACLLSAQFLRAFGLQHVVITTDLDNIPSIKTCIRIGCELESIVQVPEEMQQRLEISNMKHRYIWTLPSK